MGDSLNGEAGPAAPADRPPTGLRQGPDRRWTAVERVRALAARAGERVSRLADRGALTLEMAKVRLLPSSVLAGEVEPEADEGAGWGFLWRPALLGFVALVAVAVGASLPSSPFKLEMAGTWFFGEPAQGTTSQGFMMFGLVAVYGGLILLMRVWYSLMKALARRPGVPVRYLGWILVLWIIPMLVVAPIFSRDVFSYAAQGEMMSHHINPYSYGPFTLGAGPFVNPVDPLWGNTPAPYGPLFLMMDGFFASASFHSVLGTVVLLRLSAVVGVALVAWCVPALARSFGRDHGPIYVLAVLNPLVLLTLIGAAHNDALMVGLLVAGITAARTKHPVWGVVLCALATAIKVPAALGIVYIGWDWLGPGHHWHQRVRPVVTAGLIAGAIVLLLSAVSGLGSGWIGNLATPGTVRSWLAPATAVGMILGGALHLVGSGVSTTTVLSATRVLGLMAASALSVGLLLRSDRIGSVRAMGLSFLLFVVLGPVVQPWYLTWGVVLLAFVATGRLRTLLVALSVVSPFLGLPGGRTLLDDLIHYNPLLVLLALAALFGVLLAPIGRWSAAPRRPYGAAGLDGELASPAAGG